MGDIAGGDAAAGVALAISPAPARAGATGTLSFTLRDAAEVRVELIDANGRRVHEQSLGSRAAGPLRFALAARDAAGAPLSPGLYFVRVTAGAQHAQVRWAVLR